MKYILLIFISVFLQQNSFANECSPANDVSRVTVAGGSITEIIYMIDAEDQFGPFGEDGWWHESNPDWFDHTIDQDNTKVIKMDGRLTWENVNLNWEEKEEKEESANNVVKGNFNKQDD